MILRRWKVGWGYTNVCNMHCDFCYSADERRGNKKIALEIALDFIQKNHSFISDINYGTGENTLIEDWYKLILAINDIDKNIAQSITTNGSLGWLVEKSKNKKSIISKCINDVDISIDFADNYLHNKSRRHPEAYEWAIKTLEFCREYNIERSIVIVATNETFTLENIKKLFSIGNKFNTNIRINIYRPVSKQKLEYVLDCKLLFKGLDYILRNFKIVKISDPLFSGLLRLEHCVGDPTGNRSFRILPDGNITPSTFLLTEDWYAGNIANDKILINDLSNTVPFKKLITSALPNVCYSCGMKNICRGGAYDRRLLWYGTLNEKDPYCPARQNGIPKLDDIKLNIIQHSKRLVHDNYLPTLIFQP